MTQRDPEVQRLIDESAIRNLIAHYPRALDRQDHEMLASLFHADAIADYGNGIYKGPAAGFVEFMMHNGRPGSHWMHHYGNQIVEIDGDVAFVETYCLAYYREAQADGGAGTREVFLRVRYLDRVEKRKEEWRIAHRRVVFSPSQVLTVTEDYASDDVIKESGVKDDPVYRW